MNYLLNFVCVAIFLVFTAVLLTKHDSTMAQIAILQQLSYPTLPFPSHATLDTAEDTNNVSRPSSSADTKENTDVVENPAEKPGKGLQIHNADIRFSAYPVKAIYYSI